MKKLFLLLFLAALSATACSGPKPDNQVKLGEPGPVPVAVAPAQVPSSDDRPIDTRTVYANVTELREMNEAEVARLVQELRETDPYRKEFEINGRVKDTDVPDSMPALERGRNRLARMQIIAHDMHHVVDLFEDLGIMDQRKMLPALLKEPAKYAVDYLYPGDVATWLTELDWERHLDPVDPDLYLKTDWPLDRERAITLEGYPHMVSKSQYWVLMFWKRRGQIIFEAAKAAVTQAQNEKRKSSTEQ